MSNNSVADRSVTDQCATRSAFARRIAQRSQYIPIHIPSDAYQGDLSFTDSSLQRDVLGLSLASIPNGARGES